MIRRLLAAALLAGSLSTEAARAGTPFAEVEGVLNVDPSKDGIATLRITRLFRIVDGYLFEEPNLQANCPAPGTEVWKSALAQGDVLELVYRLVEKERRGFPFRKGRGTKGEVSFPPGGWVRRCASPQAPGSLESRMYAVFVSEQREATSNLVLKGEDPKGLKKWLFSNGERPEGTGTVRLQLSWDRGEGMPRATGVTPQAGIR